MSTILGALFIITVGSALLEGIGAGYEALRRKLTR